MFYFHDELLQVTLLWKGLVFPLHSGRRSIWYSKCLGKELDHSSWTLISGARKQLLNWSLWFHQNLFLNNACHLNLHPLSVYLFQKHCLFWIFSLFFWSRQWPGRCCVILLWLLGFHSLRYFQSNAWVAHLLFPLLSLISPSLLFLPQENQGKLTSSRTGEIELYYFSFGNLTLLPYLKAIIFYISWQEFSSTSDP